MIEHLVPGQRAQQRADDEDGEAGLVHADPAEHVAEPPTWVASSVMTSRKLMITQITSDSATCRLRWISGSARTTIVVSTAVISTPAMITTMARPAR